MVRGITAQAPKGGPPRDGHRAQSRGPWAPDAEPEAGRVRKAEEAEPRGPGHIQPGPKGRDRRDSGPVARVRKKVAAKKTPGDWSIGTITPGVTPTPGQRPGGQRDRRHASENSPDKQAVKRGGRVGWEKASPT